MEDKEHLPVSFSLVVGQLCSLVVLWFLFAGTLSWNEAAVGAGALLLAALAVLRVRSVKLGAFRPRLAWLGLSFGLPGQVVHDSLAVLIALGAALVRGEEPRGRFVTARFRRGETPLSQPLSPLRGERGVLNRRGEELGDTPKPPAGESLHPLWVGGIGETPLPRPLSPLRGERRVLNKERKYSGDTPETPAGRSLHPLYQGTAKPPAGGSLHPFYRDAPAGRSLHPRGIDAGEETARRALVVGFTSLPPNSFVVDIDLENELLLYHELVPSEKAPEPVERLGGE